MKSMKRYFVKFLGFIFVFHIHEKICADLSFGSASFCYKPKKISRSFHEDTSRGVSTWSTYLFFKKVRVNPTM